MKRSTCCQSPVILSDVCSDCKEHCDVEEFDEYFDATCIDCGNKESGSASFYVPEKDGYRCDRCEEKLAHARLIASHYFR